MPSVSNRRQFLARTARVAASALGYAFACPRFSSAASPDLDPAAVRRLASRLHGRVIVPADRAYDAARRVNYWNPRTDRRPALIARCQSAEDIARAVEFGQANELSVAVRGGGHSYLGWGTCDRGLLIDVAEMRRCSIDPAKRTGVAEGGVLTADFVAAASRYGLAPVSGECPSVGIAGLTLGGGLGWLSGKYGAACDHVLSARLVTGSSRVIRTNASRDAELFWAIRGGGGNFGIVTAFEFRLHPVRDVIAGTFSYRFEDARAVLRFFREFMAEAPDEFQADLMVVARASVEATVFYAGDLAGGERLLQPWRAIATPRRDTAKVMAYTDLHTMPPASPSDASNRTMFKGVNGVYIQRLSDDVIDIILARLDQAPEGAAIGLAHYMHGAVCRVPPEDTAFELRAADAVHLNIRTTWQDPAAADSCMAWGDDTARLLRPFSVGRMYANFQSVEGPDSGRQVFGRNHPRLIAIKKAYDPANFFRRNPNVSSRPE